MTRPFAAQMPHGPITEVLPDLFFVTGSVSLPTPVPVRISRNMTIVRDGQRLVLVNSVRLDDTGLAALDALGKVTDVIRLAAGHGMDDPFYAHRYGAKVWAVKGQRYTAGFDTSSPTTYFTPDFEMDATTTLPIPGARLITIGSKPPEGLLLLPRHDGVVVSGDSLQNMVAADEYFNFVGRIATRLMGFMHPCNIGPEWLKAGKPPKEDLRAILEVPFAHVLPSHGAPVIEGAAERYRPAIERVSSPSR